MRRGWAEKHPGPTTRVLAGAFLIAVGTAACEGVVSGGRPQGILLSASPSPATAGDSVTFEVEASGVNLIVVRLAYGDGATDSLAAEGAVGATLRRKHVYDDPGVYGAVASAVDVSESGLTTLVDSITVEVVPR